ncbi:MAG: hypothetical protein WDZ47_00560 [Bacteroidales bacterium]
MKTKRNSTSENRHFTGRLLESLRSIRGYKIYLCLLVLLTTAGVRHSFGQGVGISESSIVPHTSAILELRHESGSFKGLLIPRMTTTERLTIATDAAAAGLVVYDTETLSFWYWDGIWRSMAASPFGTANQLLGINAAGDANEYKTLLGTLNQINVDLTSAGQITLSTPQYIHTTAVPTFDGVTLSLLNPDAGVYTNGASRLTSTPPSSGTIGYWGNW